MPAEKLYHDQIPTDPAKRWASTPPILESLKSRAKDLGLWNLWLSGGEFQGMAGGSGGGLTNLEVRLKYQVSFMKFDKCILIMIVRRDGRDYGLFGNHSSSSYKLLGA